MASKTTVLEQGKRVNPSTLLESIENMGCLNDLSLNISLIPFYANQLMEKIPSGLSNYTKGGSRRMTSSDKVT